MDGLESLTNFYETIADDARIGVTHICLYMALLHVRNLSNFQSPLLISRHELMKNARISRRTYNKCINELQQFGYIKYEPSSNPFEKSRVFLNKL